MEGALIAIPVKAYIGVRPLFKSPCFFGVFVFLFFCLAPFFFIKKNSLFHDKKSRRTARSTKNDECSGAHELRSFLPFLLIFTWPPVGGFPQARMDGDRAYPHPQDSRRAQESRAPLGLEANMRHHRLALLYGVPQRGSADLRKRSRHHRCPLDARPIHPHWAQCPQWPPSSKRP